MFGLRECSADASLNVLGDDAHIRVQEQGLQLPVNPLLHLRSVQGCCTDLCLEGPAQPAVLVGLNWLHGKQEPRTTCHCGQMHVQTHASAVLEGRVAQREGVPEMVRSLLASCRLWCEVQGPSFGAALLTGGSLQSLL